VEPQEIDVIEKVSCWCRRNGWLSVEYSFIHKNVLLLWKPQLNIVLKLLKDDQVNPCARQGAALLLSFIPVSFEKGTFAL